MTGKYMRHRRTVPLHAAEPQPDAAANMAKNKNLQQDEAVCSDVQEHTVPSPEDFTISVEQVREHLRAKGLRKSKDTVQRWCRTGELTCQKSGILGRYFTTEASLLMLERKLLPDMIAENAGAVSHGKDELHLHAGANAADRSGMQEHEAESAGASSGMQPDVQRHAAANAAVQEHEVETKKDNDVALTPDANVARLAAEVDGLKAQLENRDRQIDFLQEEIRSGREQRGAVVQISNRMLETLETMAIGGRLERPRQQGSASAQSTETVQVAHRDPLRDGV